MKGGEVEDVVLYEVVVCGLIGEFLEDGDGVEIELVELYL